MSQAQFVIDARDILQVRPSKVRSAEIFWILGEYGNEKLLLSTLRVQTIKDIKDNISFNNIKKNEFICPKRIQKGLQPQVCV